MYPFYSAGKILFIFFHPWNTDCKINIIILLYYFRFLQRNEKINPKEKCHFKRFISAPCSKIYDKKWLSLYRIQQSEHTLKCFMDVFSHNKYNEKLNKVLFLFVYSLYFDFFLRHRYTERSLKISSLYQSLLITFELFFWYCVNKMFFGIE